MVATFQLSYRRRLPTGKMELGGLLFDYHVMEDIATHIDLAYSVNGWRPAHLRIMQRDQHGREVPIVSQPHWEIIRAYSIDRIDHWVDPLPRSALRALARHCDPLMAYKAELVDRLLFQEIVTGKQLLDYNGSTWVLSRLVEFALFRLDDGVLALAWLESSLAQRCALLRPYPFPYRGSNHHRQNKGKP